MFLRAAALGLAAPAALNLSRLAVAAPTGAPKRLLIFHMPHGVPNVHYNPKVGSDLTQFTLNDSHKSVLGPLEQYKQYVNVYQGFKYPPMGGPHFDAVNFLTDSQDVDGNVPRLSIDHAIGQKLGIKPLNLGASARPLGAISQYSKVFWDGTSYIDAEKNPVKAADAVFSKLQPSTPQENPDVAARKALLDLTSGEVQDLRTELSSLTTEDVKLKAHLDAIAALRDGPGTGGGSISCNAAPTMPNVEKIRALNQPDVTPEGTPNWYLGGYQGENPNFPLLLAAQMEVAANAIACNAAQIVTIQAMFSTSQVDFGFINIPRPHHLGISHVGPDQNATAPSDPLVEDYAVAQTWFTNQIITGLLTPMLADDPAAPGTKIIDNTIIYWCSEIADGQYHNLATQEVPNYHPDGTPYVSYYMPLVSIGGGSMIKTGQIVRNATDRPATDLYITLAQAMGASIPKFGDSTGIIPGVVLS